MPTKKITKTKAKAKTKVKEKVAEVATPEQRDVDLLVMVNALNDAISLINERLAIVNYNGQWACDQIQEIKDKLAVVSGRMGL